MKNLKIIDLSQYNNVTDLKKATKNCDGVILRLGIRGYSAGNLRLDSRFLERVWQLIQLKVNWGVYFLTQAISATEAEQEAVFCIENLMNLDRAKMTLGVWCDSEYSNEKKTGRADRISKARRTEYANVFCRKLVLSGFRKTGVYCSESWANSMLESGKVEYPFWIAKYGTNNGKQQKAPGMKHDMWQYTSKGSIPGIAGNVDVSVLYSILEDVPVEEKKNPYTEPIYTLFRYRPLMNKDFVRWLQFELNELGYGLAVDGVFGKDTDAALRDAQKRLGLVVDGKCGPATREKLKSV